MPPRNFPYQPLDVRLREIRLLTVVPGDEDALIVCKIHHASLTTRPAYNALSYVWGSQPAGDDGSHGEALQLEGVGVPATKNLIDALRQIRQPTGGETVCLWVDALCINQDDVAERSQQVSMMHEIYSSAERVVIWLGEAGDGSDEAFDSLPAMVGLPEEDGQSVDDDHRVSVMRQCSSFFTSLSGQRSWFSRIWILQELALASKDPLVLCGTKSAPWLTLMSAWDAIATRYFAEIGLSAPQSIDAPPSDAEASGFSRPGMKMDSLHELRTTFRKEGGLNLRQLLLMSRTSDSTDPRDRVYGLLGMLRTEDVSSGKPIVIDYRKTASEVYTDAMGHVFSRGQGPMMLSGMFLPGIPVVSSDDSASTTDESVHPSWAPDFSRQRSNLTAQPSGIIFYPPMDLGGVSGAGAGAHNGAVLDDNRTLRAEGLVVGKITEVTPLGSTLDMCIHMLPTLEEAVDKTKKMVYTYESEPISALMNQWRRSQPLWRILVSNKQWNSGYRPAPSSYEQQHQQLLQGLEEDSAGHDDPDQANWSEYKRGLQECVDRKALFATDTGFSGTGVPDVMIGDVVAIIFGAPTAFVLRPLQSNVVQGEVKPIYGLVGAAYVGGIMSGEMVDELYCEDLMDSTTFYIR